MRPALLALLLAATCAAGPATPGVGPTITGYGITGTLVESEAQLRRVLDHEMPVGAPWNADRWNRVRALCSTLQYDVKWTTETSPRGIRVTLWLEPRTLVRKIDLDFVDAGPITRIFVRSQSISAQDILSHAGIRPGDAMPVGERERGERLAEIKDRLKTYLNSQGFFDAATDLELDEDLDAREVNLEVRVWLGKAYEVGVIKVQGNLSVPSEDIVELLRQLGQWGLSTDRFSATRLENDLERVEALYRERGFPAARVSSTYDPRISLDRLTKRVNFIVNVQEGKHIAVHFEGNATATVDELEKVLTFGEERAYDDVEVQASVRAIQRLYQTRGYFQAVVTWERVRLVAHEDGSGQEHILFFIDEGPRLRVMRIEFTGNRSFDASLLRTKVSTRVFPGQVASVLQSGGHLTGLQLQQDLEALVEFYRSQGFPEARAGAVVATDRRFLDDFGALAAAVTAEQHSGGLFVRYVIEEGPRQVVRTVQYTGNRVLNDADLERATSLRRGKPFTTAALAADAQAIVRLYGDRGHPYATLTPAFAARELPLTVGQDGVEEIDIRHQVDEGEPVRFGEVLVRGNFLTRGWVVRDILDLAPGETFTLARYREAERALRTSGLFSSVELKPIGFDEGREVVDLVAVLREAHDNRGEYTFCLPCYRADFGPYTNVEAQLRNLAGIGAILSVRGEGGYDWEQTEHPWLDGELRATFPRWLMHRALLVPASLDLTAGASWQEHPRYGELLSAEGRALLSRQLGRHWHITGGYTFRYWNREEDLVRPAGPSELDTRHSVPTRTGAVHVGLSYDQREDASGNQFTLDPVRGYMITLQALLALDELGGTDDFAKLSFSAQRFWPLGSRLLLKAGFRWNHGIPGRGLEQSLGWIPGVGSDAVLLPEVERYFAGGDTTIRGLARDHALTEIVYYPAGGGLVDGYEVLPAGGNIRVLANLDLQLKIADKSFVFGLPLATGLFFDTGLVTQSLDGAHLEDTRQSVGIALMRVVLPAMGAASLEWAVPLDPGVGDDPLGRFHFNLGFVF